MSFYSLWIECPITLNLLNLFRSPLRTCSWKCPKSASVMFVMVRDPFWWSRCSLPLKLSHKLGGPDSALKTSVFNRLFLTPKVHSIISPFCILILGSRVTDSPTVTSTFFTSCQSNTQKHKYRKQNWNCIFNKFILMQFFNLVYIRSFSSSEILMTTYDSSSHIVISLKTFLQYYSFKAHSHQEQ